MATFYIPRRLVINRDQEDRKELADTEIAHLEAPIIILGDPGSGKTELTKAIEKRLGFRRVSAGTFYRTRDNSRLLVPKESRLIIDGLDEIASQSGISAIRAKIPAGTGYSIFYARNFPSR